MQTTLSNPYPTARQGTAIALTLVIAAVIGSFALSPPQLSTGIRVSDKVQHMAGFATLCLPAAALRPRLLCWVLPAAIAFGGLIEILQPLVGRQRELGDMIADVIGCGIGTAIGLILNRPLMVLVRRLARRRTVRH